MKRFDVLMQAQACYLAMERFRRDRDRNKRYNYGDQWGDIVEVDGRRITEEQFIKEQGSVPLKNNMIRRLVRDVIGVFGNNGSKIQCHVRDTEERGLGNTLSALLQYNSDLNRLDAVNARSLEEFLISGLVVHRKWYGYNNGRVDTWTDYVPPSNVFIDAGMRDFRGWDCTCIGEIHDVAIAEIGHRFAHSHDDYARIAGIYKDLALPGSCQHAWNEFGYGVNYCQSFLVPRSPNMCRVIEVWRKESRASYKCHDQASGRVWRIDEAQYAETVEAENKRRSQSGMPAISAEWVIDDVWHYYFLTPLGDVLAEGDTPYAHGSHPYVVKAYPMIDGEIHAFVSDVIDQQRYTNRLITMYDWIVRSSAKGVLMVPEDCIPRGCSPREFADTWSRFNGVMVYRPSQHGDVPKQVSSNTSNAGITDLLNLQLKFFEDISGVHGALEGKLSNASMSGALYDRQVQHATTALGDVLGAFAEFRRDGAYKDASNILQYYSADKVAKIAGAKAAKSIQASSRGPWPEYDIRIIEA